MTTDSAFLTPDVRRTANRLLDVLQRERIAAGAAATSGPHRPVANRHAITPTWRPATLRVRPVSMTRKDTGHSSN